MGLKGRAGSLAGNSTLGREKSISKKEKNNINLYEISRIYTFFTKFLCIIKFETCHSSLQIHRNSALKLTYFLLYHIKIYKVF